MKNSYVFQEIKLIYIYIYIYIIYVYILICIFMHTIFFAKNKNKKTSEDDKQGFSFGLKCDRSPLQVKDLIQFDNNLVKIEKE